MSWFITWNRPEYKEWSLKQGKDYTLLIIRKERKNNYLCVRAKLIFKSEGLPEFKIIQEKYVKSKTLAENEIKKWKDKS